MAVTAGQFFCSKTAAWPKLRSARSGYQRRLILVGSDLGVCHNVQSG